MGDGKRLGVTVCLEQPTDGALQLFHGSGCLTHVKS